MLREFEPALKANIDTSNLESILKKGRSFFISDTFEDMKRHHHSLWEYVRNKTGIVYPDANYALGAAVSYSSYANPHTKAPLRNVRIDQSDIELFEADLSDCKEDIVVLGFILIASDPKIQDVVDRVENIQITNYLAYYSGYATTILPFCTKLNELQVRRQSNSGAVSVLKNAFKSLVTLDI